MNSTTKRTQKAYSLAFKIAVVEQVKKANCRITKRKNVMISKGEAPYWFGFVTGKN